MIKNLTDHEKEEEKEKQKILQMSEVSLWLYGYDDIFSDFDPRPYSQRALSEDFLIESKRISKERQSGGLQLTFSVPEKSRDAEKEKTIKKRLHEHFKKHHAALHTERKSMIKTGIMLASAGLFMMFISAYLRYLAHPQFFYNLLFVLLEPSGWFLAWYGFDNLWNTMRKINPELEFYGRMTDSEIGFMSY